MPEEHSTVSRHLRSRPMQNRHESLRPAQDRWTWGNTADSDSFRNVRALFWKYSFTARGSAPWPSPAPLVRNRNLLIKSPENWMAAPQGLQQGNPLGSAPPKALKRSCPKGQWQHLTIKSGQEWCSARACSARSAGEHGQVPAITSLPSTLAATSRSRLQHEVGLLEGATGSCLCSVCSRRSQDPIPSSPKRTWARWPKSWYCCMLGNRTWSNGITQE